VAAANDGLAASGRAMTAAPGGSSARPAWIPTDDVRGALYMMASTAGFVANDTLMKAVSTQLHLGQALLVRGLCASGLLLLLVVLQKAARYRPDGATAGRMALRVLCEVAGTLTFLSALFRMPMANATAIFMVTPLAVTLGASLFLGESVSWRRWIAIAVGFFGVLLIVRPGSTGFNVHSLLVLAAVTFAVARDLLTRRFQLTVPSSVVALTTAVAVAGTGGLLTLYAGWRPLDASIVLALAAAAVGLVVGYLFIVMAMRVGDVGFVSPFRYSVLVWALVLGFLVFDEFPAPPTLAGCVIVVGAGILTLRQGRRQPD
jgi:drug/metabolite transporter (DMT)-like permease